MKRPITNLVIGLLAFFASQLAAQPTFTVSPQTITANTGDVITVNITVSNFTNILSFQYSMNWNPAVLQFQAPVGNVTPSLLTGFSAANIGTAQSGSGQLTASWLDPNVTGVTVANGTIVYSLNFQVLTNAGATISFSGTPTPIEVVNGNGMDITSSSVFQSANVNGGGSGGGGGGGNGGGGGGGGNNPPPTGFAVVASDETTMPGTQICVDVSVNDFDNIVSMQYTMEFDESKWQYGTVQGFNLSGLSSANFGTAQVGTGRINFSWLDPLVSGVTVADGTVIYQVCLNATGPDACSSSTPFQFNGSLTPTEVVSSGGNVTFQGVAGDLVICNSGGGGGNPSTGFAVLASDETTTSGTQICVDVSVNDFDDIVSMQYTMEFDETKWQYASIQGFNINGLSIANFGTNQSGTGRISMSWSDPAVAGITLADATVIYQVCLNPIGASACGSTTPFVFNSSLTPTEVTNGSGVIAFQSVSGDLEICTNNGGGNYNTLTFVAGEVETPAGTQICVDFTAHKFNCIVSAQYSIHFNQNIIQYTSAQGFGLSDLTAANFGTTGAANGTITFSWYDQTPDGVTVPDGTVIFQLCFNVIGTTGQVANITFDGTPTTIEVVGCTNNQSITPAFDAGSVTVGISCTGPVTVSNTAVTHILCGGPSNANTGAINITTAGGSATKTYAWTMAGNPAFTSQSEDLTNIAAGTYTVVVTSCGGTQSTTQQIVVNPAPAQMVLTFQQQDIACFGETNGSIDITVMGGNTSAPGCSSYAYIWSNGATTQDLTGLAAGNYTVTVSDCNGCKITSPIFIVSAPPSAIVGPTATFTNPSCNGSTNGSITVTATGGGNTKEYRLNTGNWQASPIFNNLIAGTYTVGVRDNFGCVKTTTVTLTQPAPLLVNLAANAPTVGMNNGSITSTITGGTPAYSCSWTGPNGSIPTPNCNPTNLAPGTYCVVVTDANGCTANKCILVVAPLVNDPLTPSAVTKNDCFGTSCDGEIDVNVQGGITPYTYTWSGPSGSNPIGEHPTGLCAGAYSVTVSSANGGPTLSLSFTIIQATNAPQGVLDPDVPTYSTASDGSISINGVNGGFGAPYTYVWSGTNQVTNPISNLFEGTYAATITDVNGCTGTVGPIVLDFVPEVLDTPQVTPSNSCSSQDNGEIAFTITGGQSPYTFAITGPESHVIPNAGNSVTFNGLPAGTYNYTITDSGIGIDKQTKTGTVTVGETTLVLTQVVTHATATQSGKVDINVTGGQLNYQYAWNHGPTSQDLLSVQPGCYEVTITDANGCIEVFSNIGVGLLTASFTSVKPHCANETGTITVLPSLLPSCATPNLDYEYKWANAQNVIVGSQPTLTGAIPGTYTVTITDDNGDGISIIETFELESESSLIAGAEVTSDFNSYAIRCEGFSNGAAIAVPSSGVAPYLYQWSNGSTQQAISGVGAGDYTVTITDSEGCKMTATVTLDEPALLASQASASNSSCTGGNTGQATVTVSGGVPPYTYLWSNGETTPTAHNLEPNKQYSVTITDSNGCTMIDNVIVPGGDGLSADGFSVSDSGGPSGEAGVTVNGGTLPYTFVWQGYPSVNDSILTELFPGTYLVLVTDANGCQVAESIVVDDATQCGEVRTVITPEGDGNNEEFVIKCLSRFSDNTLEIFNRWGQLVYRTEDYNDDNLWRGTTTRGGDAPDGVYYYVFSYLDPATNALVTKKGSVTVLRK